MEHPVLVIGGGISGITAAVELAEAGQKVVLVEKEDYLGGKVAEFNNYFPKLCPPSCGLEINFRRLRSNPLISYYTGASVKSICGSEGSYEVSLDLKPRLINNHCTACGKCAGVCPVDRPAPPGAKAGQKAAFIRDGLAFPMKYCIDPELCQGESCGLCLEVCEYGAIQLDATSAEVAIQAGRIIAATGWELYDAGRLENYHYREEADVLSNLEFEKLLAACSRDGSELLRPSDGRKPGRIAFIQCAGSRDVNHLPYCSSVCCSASLKHALTLDKEFEGIETEVFYIDMRLTGRNEKLLKVAEDKKTIKLTKGKVGRILSSGDGSDLVLEVEDITAGSKRRASFDMVVLALGLIPATLETDLEVNEFGFIKGEQGNGIIPTASCKRPMDVSSSVKDATAAALKAMQG